MNRKRRTRAKKKFPSYRRQRRRNQSDLAFVEIDGRRRYLGVYNTPQSREQYHRLLAERETSGNAARVIADDITVLEIADMYMEWRRTITSGTERRPPSPSILLWRSDPC